jgi:hypothetical protein
VKVSTTDDLRVEAAPEKRFFISMLVKDIELIPSVMDLVDNSVDGARSLRPAGDYKGLSVSLRLDGDSFSIKDNCGGIAVDTARRYAFRFGRPEGFRGITSSVGQFGVGMKRALFKIGDHFVIESRTATSTFTLTVPVKTWAEEEGPDWSFQFDSVNEKAKNAASRRGTTITVTDLHPQVRADFSRPETASRLATQISLQHQSALAGGLAISVNGRSLRPTTPRLLASKSIKPINYTFIVPATADEIEGEVEARIIAGIAASRERGMKDEGDAEEFPEVGEAGWYVFCNDRLVLAADRTPATGWGTASAAYHPQFRRFRGYVYLNAKESALLPWNTTKTGLDQDSQVFRVVQQRMFTALAAVAAVINRQKSEVQTRAEDERPITAALDVAKELPLSQLDASERFQAPQPPPAKRTAPSPSHLVNVIYKVSRVRMAAAMEASGLSSAAKVGLMSFDYFMRNEVEE